MATGRTTSNLAIGIVVVQIIMGFGQAFLLYNLKIKHADDLRLEARLDVLETFMAVTQSNRFTDEQGADHETRLRLIESDLNHLLNTHHPKDPDRGEVLNQENLALRGFNVEVMK
jgi:hypothetical protein